MRTRLLMNLDVFPRGLRFSLIPMLILTLFASSAAAITCRADRTNYCTPLDLRDAFNQSNFATCDATSPSSEAFSRSPVGAAAATTEGEAKQTQDSTLAPTIGPRVTLAVEPPAEPAETPVPTLQPDVQPQIATFDEWTKQKLQQPPPVVVQSPQTTVGGTPSGGVGTVSAGGATTEQSGSPPHVVNTPEAAAHTATATRNYASRECGAKVIHSNPEAENTKAVLNDKEKDDYMRNPCDKAQHKHIVIELCETIQPRSIEIANFELFSSGPASVRFLAAERFPSQQWSVLGEWSLADTRTVQTLPVPVDKLTYAKFIKLELLAHHGAEHYCTLSTVRVLGVSMVDEYEAEAAVAARLTVPHSVAPVVPEVPVLVVQPHAQPSKEEQTVKNEEPTAATPTDAPVVSSTEAPPVTVVEAPPVVPKMPETPLDAGKKAPGIVQDVMSGTLLKKIIEVVGGRKKEEHKSNPSRYSAYADCDRTPSVGLPRATCTRRLFFCPPMSRATSVPRGPLTAAETAAKRAAARRALVATIQRRQEESAARSIIPPPQIDAPPQRKATTTAPVVQPIPPPSSSAPKEETVPSVTKAQQPPAATPPSPSTPPPPVNNNYESQNLPASTMSHKESVFLKLNKRIAALELNMSLSTEYLSELSRQYIAHTDEQKKAMERTRVAAERAAVDVARTVNETVRDELFNLRKEVDALSAWLATLRQQAGSVALATPRRLSGTHAAESEENAPPERLSTAHVGHRRINIQDIEEEDYVSYEETYERSCPRQGHSYGPHPRPVRGSSESEEEDEEREQTDAESDAFDLRHFRHHSDGIWTTEQVLYAVLGAQALTVALVLLMQACYARAFQRRRLNLQPVQQQQPVVASAPAAVDPAELERLIDLALERRAEREEARHAPLDPTADASPRSSASSVTSSSTGPQIPVQQLQQSGNKKKRRQRRSIADQQQHSPAAHHHQCRQCGGDRDFDSAMDSSLPSPSEDEGEAPQPAPESSPSSPPMTSSSPS